MDSYQIFLTLDEINLVLTGLGKLPAEQVYDLIGSVRSQAQAQMQPAETAVQDEAPKPKRGRKPKAETQPEE